MGLTATGGSLLISRRYSEIQRAFGLFHRPARYAVGINHGSSDVAMTGHLLNSTDIVVGLQEVGGKAVSEGMRRDALGELCPADCLVKSQLNVCLMKMIAPQFPGSLHESQRLLGKKPLPYEILDG